LIHCPLSLLEFYAILDRSQQINRAEGYGEIQLLSPDALVEEGDEE
jgi:hypothetical protein